MLSRTLSAQHPVSQRILPSLPVLTYDFLSPGKFSTLQCTNSMQCRLQQQQYILYRRRNGIKKPTVTNKVLRPSRYCDTLCWASGDAQTHVPLSHCSIPRGACHYLTNRFQMEAPVAPSRSLREAFAKPPWVWLKPSRSLI